MDVHGGRDFQIVHQVHFEMFCRGGRHEHSLVCVLIHMFCTGDLMYLFMKLLSSKIFCLNIYIIEGSIEMHVSCNKKKCHKSGAAGMTLVYLKMCVWCDTGCFQHVVGPQLLLHNSLL